MHEQLKSLGSETQYTYNSPTVEILESFPNPHPHISYSVELDFPEFTSLCPKTGQPDFAHIYIKYFPNQLCVETKSLKLYLFAYRQHGAFMEDIVNSIRNDLVGLLIPASMTVRGHFNTRGGISLTVTSSY